MTHILEIERKVGMFGTCRDINAKVDGKTFATAHRDDATQRWGIDIHKFDGTFMEDVWVSSLDETVVEALIRMYFRSACAGLPQ
jgi:hypothetical protein